VTSKETPVTRSTRGDFAKSGAVTGKETTLDECHESS
jgi:hypothetical protein